MLKRRLIILNSVAKEIWLNYFNDVLLNKGLITKEEQKKMSGLILKKCRGSADRK